MVTRGQMGGQIVGGYYEKTIDLLLKFEFQKSQSAPGPLSG